MAGMGAGREGESRQHRRKAEREQHDSMCPAGSYLRNRIPYPGGCSISGPFSGIHVLGSDPKRAKGRLYLRFLSRRDLLRRRVPVADRRPSIRPRARTAAPLPIPHMVVTVNAPGNLAREPSGLVTTTS